MSSRAVEQTDRQRMELIESFRSMIMVLSLVGNLRLIRETCSGYLIFRMKPVEVPTLGQL